MTPPPNDQQPIIIVRRPRAGGDGHHGGAWKIAFADFMTAMMALFLVLWLVNAANEETKKAVASYFNPVKLVDRNRSTKGLQEEDGPREDEPDEGAENEPSRKEHENPANVPGDRNGQALRDVSDSRAGATPVVDDQIGAPETFDDPFAAIFRSQARPVVQADEESAYEQQDNADAKDAEETSEENEKRFRQVAEAIDKALTEGIADEALRQVLSVEASSDGAEITITTDTDRPMFLSGSARATPDLERVLGAVREVLRGQEGSMAIEGHTDARPFRRNGADNWTLSTDRAHTTRRLLDGAAALAAVSGHAASRPIGSDPLDPRNRRIAILFRPAS